MSKNAYYWRCAYCGLWTDDSIPMTVKMSENYKTAGFYCSEKCKNKALAFYKYAHRMMPVFYAGLAISSIIMLAGIINLIFLSAGFVLMALTMLIFPFANEMDMGIKKSKLLVRIIALIMIAVFAPIGIYLY